MKYRIEKDTMGEVSIPEDMYYGAQTRRAVDNFPVSGLTLQKEFINAQAIIKICAAKANSELGGLDKKKADAIIAAGREILSGGLYDHFVVDVFQAGAGTSQNMNANEVIANRAAEILGGAKGDSALVHPNDHVNMGQSTNDTIHAAIHIAAEGEVRNKLIPAMNALSGALAKKSAEFDGVLKSARTHLQDAVPMRLGQEFGAFATMVKKDAARLNAALPSIRELCIGGSAAGTGLNTLPGYRKKIIEYINRETGGDFREADNLFEAMQGFQAVVELTGAIRVAATGLKKIADDLRLLSSGPRTGFAEITLPPVQPGSSIMPGKINPVHAEMLNMACYHVFGCDAAIVAAAQAGQLQLNVMMPVIAYNLLQEIQILAAAVSAFAEKCVPGITADEKKCRDYAMKSASVATALNPIIGYEKAAEIAKESVKTGVNIYDLLLKKKMFSEDELNKILDMKKLTEPPE